MSRFGGNFTSRRGGGGHMDKIDKMVTKITNYYTGVKNSKINIRFKDSL